VLLQHTFFSFPPHPPALKQIHRYGHLCWRGETLCYGRYLETGRRHLDMGLERQSQAHDLAY